ncbi:hypothetical protein [Bacillus piscicola]|uniref:hypothetical protein n=1 Tax=Bacillus piscicola TaxID=1632684 RepID=UPI001F08F24A|nr:hypothetical protein [Bacillus piscicola]
MKIPVIAVIVFIAVTLIGTLLGSDGHGGTAALIAPVIGSIVTSLIFLSLLKWESTQERPEV